MRSTASRDHVSLHVVFHLNREIRYLIKLCDKEQGNSLLGGEFPLVGIPSLKNKALAIYPRDFGKVTDSEAVRTLRHISLDYTLAQKLTPAICATQQKSAIPLSSSLRRDRRAYYSSSPQGPKISTSQMVFFKLLSSSTSTRTHLLLHPWNRTDSRRSSMRVVLHRRFTLHHLSHGTRFHDLEPLVAVNSPPHQTLFLPQMRNPLQLVLPTQSLTLPNANRFSVAGLRRTYLHPGALPPHRTPTVLAEETRDLVPRVRALGITFRPPARQSEIGRRHEKVGAECRAGDLAAVGAVAAGLSSCTVRSQSPDYWTGLCMGWGSNTNGPWRKRI